LRCEIDLDNRAGLLRPGMYVHATIQVGRQNAWTLPEACIVHADNKAHVLQALDGKAVQVPVRMGLSDGKVVEVVVVQRPGSQDIWAEMNGQEQIVVQPKTIKPGQEITARREP